MATQDWSMKFPTVRVHHIDGSLSDHSLLWVCLDDENIEFYKKQRPFQFEVVWIEDDQCKGVVQQAWDGQSSTNPMDLLVCKVDYWGKNYKPEANILLGTFGVHWQNKKLLQQVKAISMTSRNHILVRTLRDNVIDLMDEEECLW